MRAALEFLAGEGVDARRSPRGGLGPTADDLTAEVVAGFAGRPLAFDAALEERIWAIVSAPAPRSARFDEASMREGSRKQAMVPEGATVLEPVGTAPGLVVPPRDGGRPRRARPPRAARGAAGRCGSRPWRRRRCSAALAGAGRYEQRMLRLLGVPEPVIAATLRELEADGMALGSLEITTCLRRGELEIATVFAPGGRGGLRGASPARSASATARRCSPTTARRSTTRSRSCSRARTVAVAESCTGGLMAARLTERAGSSAYVLGGAVVYSNEAKVALAAVPPALIERHGAVSPEVAAALADGARARFGAQYGIGITGIAGPGGGTPEKPVGTVCLSVAGPAGREDRSVRLPGGRGHIRDRTTTVAMHMLRRLLRRRAGVSVRLFVALDLPPEARAALARFRDAAADPAVWRPVGDDALHVTLAFLGHRPEEEVAVAEDVLAALPGAAPPLVLAGALLLPPRRARVLCAAIADPEGVLGGLQRAVSDGARAPRGSTSPSAGRSARTPPWRGCAPARARPRAVDAAPEALAFARRGGDALPLPPGPGGGALRAAGAPGARLTARGVGAAARDGDPLQSRA